MRGGKQSTPVRLSAVWAATQEDDPPCLVAHERAIGLVCPSTPARSKGGNEYSKKEDKQKGNKEIL